MNTRREFIATSSTLVAALAVGAMGALARTCDVGFRLVSARLLTFAELAAQVNTTFRVYASATRVVELKMIEARLDSGRPQLGQRPPLDADHEKFSLIFSGPRSEPLEQKILLFEHDQLGRFELVALPIFTRKPDQLNYQAVFNRPRKQALAGPTISVAGTDLKV